MSVEEAMEAAGVPHLSKWQREVLQALMDPRWKTVQLSTGRRNGMTSLRRVVDAMAELR